MFKFAAVGPNPVPAIVIVPVAAVGCVTAETPVTVGLTVSNAKFVTSVPDVN